MNEDHHFHRGKEARLHGSPRTLADGRITAANRAAWMRGWDEQDRFMKPAPTDEERAEASATVARLKEWATQHLK